MFRVGNDGGGGGSRLGARVLGLAAGAAFILGGAFTPAAPGDPGLLLAIGPVVPECQNGTPGAYTGGSPFLDGTGYPVLLCGGSDLPGGGFLGGAFLNGSTRNGSSGGFRVRSHSPVAVFGGGFMAGKSADLGGNFTLGGGDLGGGGPSSGGGTLQRLRFRGLTDTR